MGPNLEAWPAITFEGSMNTYITNRNFFRKSQTFDYQTLLMMHEMQHTIRSVPELDGLRGEKFSKNFKELSDKCPAVRVETEPSGSLDNVWIE
jgi:hypothetical protein